MTAKASYRAVKPYVTLQVLDGNGSPITLGFYEGGLIESPVAGEHLDQLVESGYVEKVAVAKAPASDDDGKGRKPASAG